MSALALNNIKKRFGSTTTIHGVDLTIEPGEFIVFVGPSGCGKSTLLRMIAGLESVSSGTITINDKDVTDLAPNQRDIAMVFQSYALYPHMSVAENLSFGMRMRNTPKNEISERVGKAVDILQLGDYLQRKPGELSGGQCQRVAIGRALVQEPEIFLFDEPLSNLDAELRVKMRLEIAALHRRLGNTMIYVTHDQTEAMTLADRIVVLKDGQIEQVGTPMELYQSPKTEFVAGFIGSPKMNLLPITLINGAENTQNNTTKIVFAHNASLQQTLPYSLAEDKQDLTLGVRPEHITIDANEGLEVKVSDIEQLGAISFIYCQLAGKTVCVQTSATVLPAIGDTIYLNFASEHVYLFDTSGNTLMRKANVNTKFPDKVAL